MKTWKVEACFLVAIVTGLATIFVCSWNGHKEYQRVKAQVAVLETQNVELAALCEAQGKALEAVRASAAAQSERLAKAQTTAAKTRAQSETRVQTILTAPIPALVGQSPSAALAGGGAPRTPTEGAAEGQRALALPGGGTVDVDALAAWAAKEAKGLAGRLHE